MFSIQLNNANVHFYHQDKDKKILSNLQWQWLPTMDIWLQGDNGAGKSTFIKLITGKIWPDNHDKLNQHNKLPRMYQFGVNQSPQHTLDGILENISLATTDTQIELSSHQMTFLAIDVVYSGFMGTHTYATYNKKSYPLDIQAKHQNIVDTLVKQLEINEALLTQAFLNLSNGQQALILILRALVQQPRCLVIDEIFNGIDEVNIQRIYEILDKIKQQTEINFLIASHTLSTNVQSLLSHRMVMKHGKIDKFEDLIQENSENNSIPMSLSLKAVYNKKNIKDCSVYKNDPLKLLIDIKKVKIFHTSNHPSIHIEKLTILKNQHILLKGSNGSGKSTLLEMIYGQLKPSTQDTFDLSYHFETNEGEYYMPNVLSFKQQKMAYISPKLHHKYHGYYTIFELVLSGFFSSIGVFFYQKMTQDMQQKASYYLNLFGLKEYQNHYIRDISQGQLHKALLARAMINDAQLLLLDEVDQYLDINAKISLFENLAQIASFSNKTIIMASHFLDEANCPPWIKQIIYMHEGKIKNHYQVNSADY